MPIPLPILPQLPGPFQIVRSVNYPSIPIAGQLPIPQLLRLGTGRTPGRRQTLILSKAKVSPSNLLGSSLTGLPRGAPSLFNCPRVCYEVHQSGSRTGPLVVAPSFSSRGECISRCSSGGILPRRPPNNSSFVHTLGITKLKVVFRGEIVSRKVPVSCGHAPLNIYHN